MLDYWVFRDHLILTNGWNDLWCLLFLRVWANESQNLRNILKIGDEPNFADLPRTYITSDNYLELRRQPATSHCEVSQETKANWLPEWDFLRRKPFCAAFLRNRSPTIISLRKTNGPIMMREKWRMDGQRWFFPSYLSNNKFSFRLQAIRTVNITAKGFFVIFSGGHRCS